MGKLPILCPGPGVLFENVTKHHIQESQEVRPFSTGDHKGATCQHSSNHCHAYQPVLMYVALLSISPASHGQLIKMLITLEPHGIFVSNCIRVYLNIVQPLVCKTVTRLLGKI